MLLALSLRIWPTHFYFTILSDSAMPPQVPSHLQLRPFRPPPNKGSAIYVQAGLLGVIGERLYKIYGQRGLLLIGWVEDLGKMGLG